MQIRRFFKIPITSVGMSLLFCCMILFSASASVPSPDSLIFQEPPSGERLTVYQGSEYTVKVQVFDVTGSKVGEMVLVTLQCTRPEVIDVVEETVGTDATGMAAFSFKVSAGDLNDTIPVIVSLPAKPEAKDTVFLIVGLQPYRLLVFYGDTLSYDADAKLQGCSGEWVPVTVRAMVNGSFSEIATECSVTFSIQLSIGLATYADRSSTVKLTAAGLVDGEVKLWLQSTLVNVVNGSITCVSSDPDCRSGNRSGISFIPCFKPISSAVCSADNGMGSVDRADIRYGQKLSSTEIPDSILFHWPSSDGEQRTVHRNELALDPQDSTHLTARFPMPFSGGITGYSGADRAGGVYYWKDPASPDAPSLTIPFPVDDGVGPLLADAQLMERLTAGNDTIHFSFTENTECSVITGNTLLLIKNGEEFTLNVLAAAPETDSFHYTVIVEDWGENSPFAGDSIRINPNGPIVDASGNHAHPQNRPVVLLKIPVVPDIVNAEYSDRDADGTVETVRFRFNKVVDPNATQVQLRFDTLSSTRPAAASDFTVVDEINGTVLDVAISGLFSSGDLQNKTSGAMTADIAFMDYGEGAYKSTTVRDKAAPVLATVEYHFSGTSGAGEGPDTLVAGFSEMLGKTPGVDQPLLFVSKAGNSYTVKVSFLDVVNDEYRFLVGSVDPGEGFPTVTSDGTGDAAWINATFADGRCVVDKEGNIQTSPANRRAVVATVSGGGAGVITGKREVEHEDKENDPKPRGCGMGSGLALIPPLFYYSRKRMRKR